MEVEVKINATAKEVFDELSKTILEDIKNSTGKSVQIKDVVENYSYKKRLTAFGGNSVGVVVNINKLTYPTHYSASIKSEKDINTIEYNLIDCEDGVTINYKESFTSSSIFRKINNVVMSFLFKRGNKKKMYRNFMLLEQQILDKKDKNNK